MFSMNHLMNHIGKSAPLPCSDESKRRYCICAETGKTDRRKRNQKASAALPGRRTGCTGFRICHQLFSLRLYWHGGSLAAKQLQTICSTYGSHLCQLIPCRHPRHYQTTTAIICAICYLSTLYFRQFFSESAIAFYHKLCYNKG